MKIQDKKKQTTELLKIHYGFSSFRPGQERIIDDALEGRDSLVIMPTGGGKSLCYQLPALVLDGVTIVVSPLIALMKDQVDSLEKIGIPATFINSSLSLEETKQRIKAVSQGKYKLLYVAPERFYNKDFLGALERVEVSLFAVDEAHCISSWGHDFRPSYLKLKETIVKLGQPTVMALTATATLEVRQDIAKQLGLENFDLVITGFNRPNLQFGATRTSEAFRPKIVLDAIRSTSERSGIIYVGTRTRADQLLQFLLDNDMEAVGYHAGMDGEERKWVQNNFMTGKAKVIVATNAFGLGINKADIGFVIHYDMPGTIEAYYQEAGRAGRDGKPSFCLLLFSSRDRHLQEFFIKGDNPSPETILDIYEILTSFEADRVLITYAELISQLSESVPDLAIATALKILEKEGYISRTREKVGKAYLKLSDNLEVIKKTIGPRAKIQAKILDKLIERFGSELNRGLEFNLDEVAGILDVKKETLRRMIRKLEEEGLAEYKPPFKGTEINILERVKKDEVKLNFEALRAKMKHAYAKLDRMEDYVYHFGCRPKYILDYFGESNTSNCNRCDNCLMGTKYSQILADKPEEAIVSEREELKIKTKLSQLETYELYEKGKGIDEIAQLRNLKPATIVDHFCFLIDKGLPIKINKFVNQAKQKKIKQAIKRVGGSKLSLIKDSLDDSVNWNEIKLVLARKKKG